MNRLIAITCALLTAALLAGCSDDSKGSGSAKKAGAKKSTSSKAAATSDKQWSAEPKMTIDKSKTYTATLTTSKGTVEIMLDAKAAPHAVNNFVFLAREGFYDNVVFHRIIKNFMIQTGDPEGTGTGGPGYTIQDDATKGAYEPGTLAMANTGAPNSGGSQFFIVQGATAGLPNTYPIFGKVTEGLNVIDEIAATPVEDNGSGEPSKPTETIRIESVEITEA